MLGYKFSYKTDDEPEFITRCLIRNKEDVLKTLQIIKERKIEALKKSNSHSSAYYSIIESLYDNFIKKIKSTPIMTINDSWWYYAIEDNQDGIKLKTSLIQGFSYRIGDDGVAYFREHSSYGGYVVERLSLRELTVEEYAEKYGVESVTVRQWIRRGKLRSAKKIGNEWRIPELTDIPRRGYEPATYSMIWEYQTKRNEINSPYDFLIEANNISINQDKKDKSKYIVSYDSVTDWDYHKIEMESKEREKLELYLISTPYFKYSGRGATSNIYETKNGDSLFGYLDENVTADDLKKTGPGIEEEDQFDLNMKLDGFVIDDDKVYFPM
ncbi:helix-turn-helix domain-containing protein [Holdemanella porci]|uniref:helix-turn-helix domain-containing protein n=1 Tax=Holdemanella porci TaxID=2652276 RepID=UPI003F90B4B0